MCSSSSMCASCKQLLFAAPLLMHCHGGCFAAVPLSDTAEQQNPVEVSKKKKKSKRPLEHSADDAAPSASHSEAPAEQQLRVAEPPQKRHNPKKRRRPPEDAADAQPQQGEPQELAGVALDIAQGNSAGMGHVDGSNKRKKAQKQAATVPNEMPASSQGGTQATTAAAGHSGGHAAGTGAQPKRKRKKPKTEASPAVHHLVPADAQHQGSATVKKKKKKKARRKDPVSVAPSGSRRSLLSAGAGCSTQDRGCLYSRQCPGSCRSFAIPPTYAARMHCGDGVREHAHMTLAACQGSLRRLSGGSEAARRL
jgi:hypothetical protein